MTTETKTRVNADAGNAMFQNRVAPWGVHCFGQDVAIDHVERNDRFIEEALELIQSTGCNRDRAHALVDFVFNRPVGEPRQEVGGVMVTLALLCHAHGMDMHEAGEVELDRIWPLADAIREKRKRKPTGAALPVKASVAAADVLAERRRQIEAEGWTPEHDDTHENGEMARAAACYALGKHRIEHFAGWVEIWPWARKWVKPTDRRRDLVKAGALIIAEIERLDRATPADPA